MPIQQKAALFVDEIYGLLQEWRLEVKKYKVLGIFAVSAIMLTGCADSMPEMTAEQSGIVAEYAAGLLLKYSPRYEYMLVSEDELKAALNQRELEEQLAVESSAAPETSAAEETKESKEPVEEETADAGNEGDNPNGEEAAVSDTEVPEQQFADADADLVLELGLDEKVSLRYQSFEICDSYPQNADGFSGVDAAEGKKLLVMHFDVENDTDEAAECALYNYSIRIKATVNDEIKANAKDNPMLPNDMASYEGEIKPGEKADLAAVAEIAEMSDEDITSLVISISSSKGSSTIKVR